ncbi:hypothetical protein [Vibrio injensis]|uniref:hypothetical protein n=1 Tax=Vibrio injensis TaxID=1307414 RepID=UPI00278BF547|nr:hypothetical protein [Vibrio injensis]
MDDTNMAKAPKKTKTTVPQADSNEKIPLTQHQTRKKIEDILEQRAFEKQYGE